MAKKKKRPELVHCKVRFSNHPKAPWRVSYPAERDGQPVTLRKTFAVEDAAWLFAEETDREIANHGIRYGDIPPEVRRAFDFYRDEKADIESAGATVPRFEDIVSGALAEIRRRHREQAENAVTVAEGVEMFAAYKEKRVKHRQLADIKDRLKRFAQDFGDRPIPSITTAEIDVWLSSLRSRRNPAKLDKPPLLAPLSRNHYRAVLHAFFGYGAAPARAWCERNAVSDLEPEQVETSEPEAYSPEDAGRIMQAALESKPDLVPVLALGMFAGLRVSEALEIDLSKLSKDEEELRVGADHKTGARMAPYTAACKAWLAAQPRRKGKAWLMSPRSLVDEMQALFTLAKVDQIDNGARHSFISYRTAESRDIARVADECGNSVGTIKAHYRQLVTTAAAEKYFAIRPEKKRVRKSKITNIETGRKSA